jgi:hypothetical protein
MPVIAGESEGVPEGTGTYQEIATSFSVSSPWVSEGILRWLPFNGRMKNYPKISYR